MNRLEVTGLTGLFLSACVATRPPATTRPTTDGAPTMQMTSTTITTATAIAFIEHDVASFDSWKTTFDGFAEGRSAGGVVAARASRSVGAPNHVVVCLSGRSFADLSTFLASPARRQAMQSAGVIGTPVTTIATPVEDRTVRDRALSGAYVRHRVVDFDAWKRGFDDRSAARAKAGIVGHAVARTKDDPNDVIVFLQAEDPEALRRFTSSDDLKKAMTALGAEAPRVTLVEAFPLER